MNSKTAALLFTLLSLGGMVAVPALTVAPTTAYAQLLDEDELVRNLLDDLGITDDRLVRDLLDDLGIIDDEEEEDDEDEDEVVWCYLRQGDVRVCFESQEECQQALDDDDLSVTSHCERFETPPPNAVFP
jgi:hypothetical protein